MSTRNVPAGHWIMGHYVWVLDWANTSVGKNKGGETTTRTEIETEGSGKDLGFWLWVGVENSLEPRCRECCSQSDLLNRR